MSWNSNKDFIISQVNAGNASSGQQAWYDRWVASGRPSSESGMLTKEEYAAASAPRPAPRPTPAPAPDLGGLTLGGRTPVGGSSKPPGVTGSGYSADAPLNMSEQEWLDNRGFIVNQVRSGNANPNQQYWYDTWVAAGRPNPYDAGNGSGNAGGGSAGGGSIGGGSAGGSPTGGSGGGIGGGTSTGSGAALPPPSGGPIVPWEPGLSEDTSWDWDYFSPKNAGDGAWGGYDADYGVFENYQPGQDAVWGMPNVAGGNREFYQQQFNNLVRDEQNFRTRQRTAAMRRQEAAENPQGAPEMDWSWANNGQGLRPVRTAQSDGQGGTFAWTPNSALGPDFGYKSMTDKEIFNALSPQLKGQSNNVLSDYFADPAAQNGYYWSSFTNPNQALSSIGVNSTVGPELRSGLTDLYNTMFSRADLSTPAGGGPTAAPGYASPI